MANLLLWFIIAAILILFAFQEISIRITYLDEFIIDFSFMFFSWIFYPTRKKRKKEKTKFKNNFKKFVSAKKALAFLFPRADIYIHEINLETNSQNPANEAIYSQNISSFLSFVLTYISIKAKNIVSEDNIFVSTSITPDYESPTIDISLETTFLSALLALFVFSFETIRKRGKKVVRN